MRISRREFLGCLGAGALAESTAGASWTAPPILQKPNILIVMVDQMRWPVWLSHTSSSLVQALPNIMGRLRSHAYCFSQYYTAATRCTPARATLLTGLYAPQTAVYLTSGFLTTPTPPSLNTAYPTWGEAVSRLNSAYQGNVWWFGKWHLSTQLNSAPLCPYGFHTRTYPGGLPPYNPSPNGQPNEGTDGGTFGSVVYASDQMIADDFIGWLKDLPQRQSPWCATVSLINPHDITYAPAWLQRSPFPPPGVPHPGVYFPPPAGSPPSFYTAEPSPWNYENLANLPDKPSLQLAALNEINRLNGPVSDWVLFLNQYLWLQGFVDQQVGAVLDALAASPFANNTIVVFLSDHGEYAGSHGMHTKGYAVYDEAIHVPLYVQFPKQTAQITMKQMCSSVDFFGLICDFATGGTGQWKQEYPDLAGRQSIWNFLYRNSRETRVAPAPVSIPYILHTFDDTENMAYSHITCLRTKLAKLAFYADWASCTTYPDATTPQPEFYDYSVTGMGNTAEIGNDFYNPDITIQNIIAQYQTILGGWGPPASGIIGSELTKPLVGTGRDGKPLSEALTTAQQAYFKAIGNTCAI